ncbi:hypothetical protein UY3_11270 [Chelonia mydas]|uniref:Uncharacterized protein n=1 Tax=Chelonia mydas TaxID=8469 RepID=M7B390_CHEMY|nr:hypothetical protein UY3_11270 [Chelonia mydas]
MNKSKQQCKPRVVYKQLYDLPPSNHVQPRSPLGSNEVSDSDESFTFIFHRNCTWVVSYKDFSNSSTGAGTEEKGEPPQIPGSYTAPIAPTCSNICKRNGR